VTTPKHEEPPKEGRLSAGKGDAVVRLLRGESLNQLSRGSCAFSLLELTGPRET
jgi:hypothetical protein